MTIDLGSGRRLILAGTAGGAWGWLTAGFAAILLCTILYRYERKLVARGSGLGLLALRLVAVSALILALFEPISALTRRETLKGRLIVGVDLSESMTTQDPGRPLDVAYRLAKTLRQSPGDATGNLSRRDVVRKLIEGEWMKELSSRHSVELIGFARDSAKGDSASVAELLRKPSDRNDPATELSDWSGVLEKALEPSDAPVLGVVLLTDGQRNAGFDQALETRLAERKIPVHSVMIGSSKPPRDAAISEVRSPEQVFKGDTARIEVALKLDGMAGIEVSIMLERPGGSPLRQTVIAPADGSRPVVSFSLKLESPGPRSLALAVGPIARDVRPDNDRRLVTIQVVDDKSKILLIETEPRWEFRYLRNALMRDERVAVDAIVFHQPSSETSPPTYPSKLPSEADQKAIARTESQASSRAKPADPLAEYDAIVLGDLDPADLTSSLIRRLDRYVAEGGGTLVVSSGPRLSGLLVAGGAGLADLLPVVEIATAAIDSTALDPDRPSLPAGLSLVPSQEALQDPRAWPWFQLDPNETRRSSPESTLELWRNLPRQPFVLVGKAKPAASSLAGVVGADGRRGAAMVAQNYGLGKVLWIGTDGTWRWRYRACDKIHHRFWGQIVRWSAGDKLATGNSLVRFGPTRGRVAEGEKVRIQARFAGGVTGVGPDLVAAARIISVKNEQMQKSADFGSVGLAALRPVAGKPRTFEAVVPAPPRGNYSIVLDAPELEKTLAGETGGKPIKAQLEVAAAETSERVELASTREPLDRLAANTGGKVVVDADAGELAQSLQAKTKTITQIDETTLWDRPAALVVFILIVTTEWIWRKRLGLP